MPGIKVDLLIGGKFRGASNGRSFERCNPITGDVASTAAAATLDDVREAVDAAEAAFPEWSALGPTARRAKLMAAADHIEKSAPQIIEAMKAEIGSTDIWADFNVRLSANMLREAAAMTTQIDGLLIPSDVPGSLAMAVRAPAGVCLGIAPWNAPVILGVRSIAMPLACGNTVVMKASEKAPATQQLIAAALVKAGLNNGEVNVISNHPEDAPAIVESLIASPAIRRINFTGSTAVGRKIALLAAQELKPTLLELGGKASLLVLADADIDAAVDAAAFSAFINQGQVCMSTERVIVDEKIADEFVEKLAAKASKLLTGDPREGPVVIGSLVDPESVIKVMGLVDDALSKGARLLCGNTAKGTVMSATVIDGVTPEMQIYYEESFGPVASVIRVSDVDEAIKVANDTEYGLTAAVFSRDFSLAHKVASQIKSGMCHINGPTIHDEAQMPFGGTKSSGYGRFGGKAAIDEFTELRWITVQNEPRHYPF